jgi:hypothetical protein
MRARLPVTIAVIAEHALSAQRLAASRSARPPDSGTRLAEGNAESVIDRTLTMCRTTTKTPR